MQGKIIGHLDLLNASFRIQNITLWHVLLTYGRPQYSNWKTSGLLFNHILCYSLSERIRVWPVTYYTGTQLQTWIYKFFNSCIKQDIVEKLFHLKLLKFVPKDIVYALCNDRAMTMYVWHRGKVLCCIWMWPVLWCNTMISPLLIEVKEENHM